MRTVDTQKIQKQVDEIYRSESRRVLATLIRLLGDFDLAEEALHDAFTAAVQQWPIEGLPDNPRAWLVSTGKFKAIDKARRHSRYSELLDEIAAHQPQHNLDNEELLDTGLHDDRLRLIFTCCHPAISPDAQIALTLREICDLSTEEIAQAFLTRTSTMAQRIVRAKNKIRSAGIPYEVPGTEDLPSRLHNVLKAVYLVFNEGYSASAGDTALRVDLSQEAIRLGRLLVSLLPDPECMGLLGLMLLHDSRRDARTDGRGDIVLLEDQDRALWHQEQIFEGCQLAEQALSSNRIGAYGLQAAIAAVHAESESSESVDWTQIVGLYDLLIRVMPSPVVELNRAVAIAMRDGEAEGLRAIGEIVQSNELKDYHFLYASKAELHRRLGEIDQARHEFEKAYNLARQAPERRWIQKQLQNMDSKSDE